MEMEKKDKQGKWPLLTNLKLKKDQSIRRELRIRHKLGIRNELWIRRELRIRHNLGIRN